MRMKQTGSVFLETSSIIKIGEKVSYMVYISMDRVKIKTVGDEELHSGLM